MIMKKIRALRNVRINGLLGTIRLNAGKISMVKFASDAEYAICKRGGAFSEVFDDLPILLVKPKKLIAPATPSELEKPPMITIKQDVKPTEDSISTEAFAPSIQEETRHNMEPFKYCPKCNSVMILIKIDNGMQEWLCPLDGTKENTTLGVIEAYDNRFKCQHCGKGYVKEAYLEKHIIKEHTPK